MLRGLPDEAFPEQHHVGRRSQRYAERRRQRRIRRTVARVCVPPSPRAWAAFGRSVVVPPARVTNPDCIAIGDGVVIHENVWLSVVRHFPDIEPRLVIEDRVVIGRSCQISVAGELVIERNAIVGDFVHIGDTFHPYETENRMRELVRPVPVRIGRGAVIGGHAVILPGVTVGAGAYIEHHAVVGRDVAANETVAGHPARPVMREGG